MFISRPPAQCSSVGVDERKGDGQSSMLRVPCVRVLERPTENNNGQVHGHDTRDSVLGAK
jgi:hypothetical protein